MSVLEVKNIKKNFGKTEVLKGISFSLEKGEVLSIIGSSGSGKTTLLRCLNFLEFADEGTISVNDKIIFDGASHKELSETEIRDNRLHFGLVFQSFNLFPQYNVLENITLAPTLLKRGTPEEIDAKAKALIERVGLSDKIDEVYEYVKVKFDRTATAIYCKERYSGEEKMMLYCIVSPNELPVIVSSIKEIDNM